MVLADFNGEAQTITAIVSVLITIAVFATAAVVRYFLGRRRESGQVATSPADVLWAQAQQMREMLLAEKTHAEEQRDKLMDSQSANVLPALSALTNTMTAVHEIMTRVVDTLSGNRDLYTSLAREIREYNATEIRRLRAELDTTNTGLAQQIRDAAAADNSRRAAEHQQMEASINKIAAIVDELRDASVARIPDEIAALEKARSQLGQGP